MNSQWGFREKQQRWPPLFILKLHSHTSHASKTPFRLKIHLKLDVWQWFMYLTVFIKNNNCCAIFYHISSIKQPPQTPNYTWKPVYFNDPNRAAMAEGHREAILAATFSCHQRYIQCDQYFLFFVPTFLKNCLVMF